MNSLRFAPIYDPANDLYYQPFVDEELGIVGFRVGRTDDRPDAETFIYLSPSCNDTSTPDDPNVFVYIGGDADPAHDNPEHFYTLDREAFGLEAR